MKIYKLNLDVDNYQGCFINETNLTKRDFKEINRGRKLTFKEENINAWLYVFAPVRMVDFMLGMWLYKFV